MRFPETLLVEDGRHDAGSFQPLLRDAGFRVRALPPARDVEAGLLAAPTDLVLLDVARLNGDAISLVGRFRARSTAPIVCVAQQTDEADRIAALEMGVDDVLHRSLSERELIARIRAILRRGAIDTSAPRRVGQIMRFEGWSANLRMRELVSPAGAAVDLTAAEFELLSGLIENPRRTMARDQLLMLAPTCGEGATGRAVDVLVSRLRRKMAQQGGVSPIVTVRGLGYRLEADVTAVESA